MKAYFILEKNWFPQFRIPVIQFTCWALLHWPFTWEKEKFYKICWYSGCSQSITSKFSLPSYMNSSQNRDA
jgi:hypothetical protein